MSCVHCRILDCGAEEEAVGEGGGEGVGEGLQVRIKGLVDADGLPLCT